MMIRRGEPPSSLPTSLFQPLVSVTRYKVARC
jgi:hypothetical protein